MIALRIILDARQNDAKSPPVAMMRARSEELQIDYSLLPVVSLIQRSCVHLRSTAALCACSRVCVCLRAFVCRFIGCKVSSLRTDGQHKIAFPTHISPCGGT